MTRLDLRSGSSSGEVQVLSFPPFSLLMAGSKDQNRGVPIGLLSLPPAVQAHYVLLSIPARELRFRQ